MRAATTRPATCSWRPTSASGNQRRTGGTVRFGRLFMVATNLQIADAHPQDPFEFYLTYYDNQLAAGLNGTTGVIILEDYALSNDAAANPAKYGYTNVTATACANNAFGGSSIVCNASNVVAGSTQYAFSDSVHPTPYSHQKEADAAVALMVAAGWQ